MNLSVVITTKNRPALLGRAIASVHRAAPGAEVIVVDDGSESAAAVREVCSGHGVRLLRNDPSRGPSYARNRGLEAASFRFWAALDDDDEWLPNRWDSIKRLLETYGFPEDLVAVSAFRSVTSDGREKRVEPAVRAPARFDTLSELFAAVRPRVFLNTYVAPTELVRRVGGYDARLRWGEHTDLLIRLAKVASFAGTPHDTVVVHVPSAGQGRNWRAKVDGIDLLLEKHEAVFELDPALLGLYRHVLGVTQLRTGNRWGAVRTFARLGRTAPTPGRRARAVVHCAAAAVAGPRLWQWISRAPDPSGRPESVAP